MTLSDEERDSGDVDCVVEVEASMSGEGSGEGVPADDSTAAVIKAMSRARMGEAVYMRCFAHDGGWRGGWDGTCGFGSERRWHF